MKLAEFESLNVEVLACSTDSWFSHLAWLQTPKREGGIEGVQYTLLSDFNKTIARDYDVLLPGGMALRGAFLVDKEGIVQSQVVNNLPIGRSVDELLRTIKALQFCEENGEVCPADWNADARSMKATPEGLREYFSEAERDPEYSGA